MTNVSARLFTEFECACLSAIREEPPPPSAVQWKDIPIGQIFTGDSRLAPREYPPGMHTGSYGCEGPWLKVSGQIIYSFQSGGHWNVFVESSNIWFEKYRPMRNVRLVEVPDAIR